MNYSNVFDKKYLVEKIYLNVIGYYEQNSQNKNISFAPIRGGCLSEINNNLKLIDISNASQNEKLNQILNTINQNDNLEVIYLDGNNYAKITLNLLQGNLTEDFCKYFINYNSISKAKIINSILKDENIKKLDEYQNSLGIYKLILEHPEKIKNKNELMNKNIFGENAAFYIRNDEDIQYWKH